MSTIFKAAGRGEKRTKIWALALSSIQDEKDISWVLLIVKCSRSV